MDFVALCYLITNKINNKKYVGVTRNFNGRMASHKYRPPTGMAEDVVLHGWESFTKEVILEGSECLCYALEDYLIHLYNCEYNTLPGGKTGGSAKGELNGNNVFSDEEIVEIRIQYATGNYTMVQLGTLHNTGNAYISDIVAGRFRREAGGPIDEKSKVRKLTGDMVEEIRYLYKDTDTSYKEIAEGFPVSNTAIGKIIRGERWKEASGPIKGVDY